MELALGLLELLPLPLLVIIICVRSSLGIPLVRKLGLSAMSFIMSSFTLAIGSGVAGVALIAGWTVTLPVGP